MSSELSPSSGELSCVFDGLVRAMAPARMAASSVRLSSVVSVSAGGAKVMSSGMGSEPLEAVCSVFAARGDGFQGKSKGCRVSKKWRVSNRVCIDGDSGVLLPKNITDTLSRKPLHLLDPAR